MRITVRIPTPLRRLTRNQAAVEATGSTIHALIEDLDKLYPGIGEKLIDEAGETRPYVNVYVNEEDIRFLDGPNTQLRDGDTVSIVPAIAGGCACAL